MRRLRFPHPRASLLAIVLLLRLRWAGSPLPYQGADAGTLQQEIDAGRSTRAAGPHGGRARVRAGASGRPRRLGPPGPPGRRPGAGGSWEARLARSEADLRRARGHALALRVRLERDRRLLADTLRSGYMVTRPDLVAVVLGSTRLRRRPRAREFLRRVQHSDTLTSSPPCATPARGRAAMRAGSRLEPRQREQTAAAQPARRGRADYRRPPGASRGAGSARAARLAALANAASVRRRAQHELAPPGVPARGRAQPGPGGPWAIPWPIVECESGGQNLPPNSASASGYYQMLDSTWHGLGGSTPHAYQASKAEQDRLAARLWAGGAGARNWVCAALVGLL